MRRFIVALAFLLAGLSPALAQNSTIIGGGVYGDFKKAAAGYTGPGDIVASVAWWGGVRAYNAADRGNALLNVCYSTSSSVDAGCVDFSSDATTGAIVATKPDGTHNCPTNPSPGTYPLCTVKIIYDRSGGAHNVTQATIASRYAFAPAGSATTCPTVTTACINSLVTPTNSYVVTIASTSQPFTFSAVLATLGYNGNAGFYFFNPTTGVDFYNAGTGNAWEMYSGGSNHITPTETDGVTHAAQIMFNNGGTSVANIDGTETTGTLGTNSLSTSVNLPDAQSANEDVSFEEFGVWASGFTGTQRTNMCHNQYTYYTTGASC